jgi:hypothetical protein
MLIIIVPKTGELRTYTTLIDACKHQKWMNYYTLRNKNLSDKVTIYKNMWIYRVIINH